MKTGKGRLTHLFALLVAFVAIEAFAKPYLRRVEYLRIESAGIYFGTGCQTSLDDWEYVLDADIRGEWGGANGRMQFQPAQDNLRHVYHVRTTAAGAETVWVDSNEPYYTASWGKQLCGIDILILKLGGHFACQYGTIWSFQLLKNGDLVRDMYPVLLRVEEGNRRIYGLYDQVSGDVFEPQGSGTVIPGDVVLEADDEKDEPIFGKFSFVPQPDMSVRCEWEFAGVGTGCDSAAVSAVWGSAPETLDHTNLLVDSCAPWIAATGFVSGIPPESSVYMSLLAVNGNGFSTNTEVVLVTTLPAPIDIYVAPDGEGDGSSRESPLCTIASAITAANTAFDAGKPLATIHLATGTYQEYDLNLTRGIRIVGEGATRGDVIVQASATAEDSAVYGHRVFRLAHADAMLANLTVRNGWLVTGGAGTDSGANGGNVLIYNGGTVTNCVLDSGRVEHTADGLINGALGGNLYIFGNGLAVDCDIANGIIQNVNNCGGGCNVVLHGDGGRLLRCIVRGGRRANGASNPGFNAAGGSGIYMNGACVAENCLITGNSGTTAAVALFGGTCRLVNCTVVGNTGDYHAFKGVWANTTEVRAVNCVIYDNGGTSAAEWGGVCPSAFVNCAVPTGCEIAGGTGNIVATDFAFVNLDVSDYRPTKGTEHSVLAGAGTSVADYAAYGGTSTTDLNGNPRWTDGSLDIGCYVAVQPGDHQPLIVRGEAKTLIGYIGATMVLSSSSTGEAGDEVTYHWDFGDGETLDTTKDQITHSYAKAGNYVVTIFGTTTTKTSETFEVGQIHVAAHDYFVATSGVDAEGRGLTADDPFRTIRFALRQLDAPGKPDEPVVGDVTIHLSPGTYQEWDLNVAEDIRIIGEGATRDDVIVQARSSLNDQSARGHRVFRLAHAGATLANLTVRFGYWETKGGGPDSGANGGNVLICGGGTVTNCVLDSGVVIHSKDALIKGALGGNLYIYGNGLAVDCDIVNGIMYNTGGCGGGGNVVLHGDGGRLLRCRVMGGHRLDYWPSGQYAESGGSGIYMNGACVAESCLVQGNSDTCGAVALFGGACRLVNCTVVGNSNTSEFYGGRNGVWVNSSAARVVNCAIYGNGGTPVSEWGEVNGACYSFCAFPTDCTTGEDSLAVDSSAFLDYDHGNFRIVSGSPLVNHGSTPEAYPQTGAVSPTDLDGNPRIHGRRLDIGCYELPQQKGLILLVE